VPKNEKGKSARKIQGEKFFLHFRRTASILCLLFTYTKCGDGEFEPFALSESRRLVRAGREDAQDSAPEQSAMSRTGCVRYTQTEMAFVRLCRA